MTDPKTQASDEAVGTILSILGPIGAGIAPALITNPIALVAVIALLRGGPALYKAVVDLIHNTNPTKADYLKLLQYRLDGWSEQTYVDLAAGKPVPPDTQGNV